MVRDSTRLSLSELAETLDALREGLQVISPQWRYLYINQAAAAHGRKEPEDLLGKTMHECYPGIEDTHVFEVMRRCMEERRSHDLENEFAFGEGDTAWFELKMRPCEEGLVVLSIDITERKRLEQAMARMHTLQGLAQMATGVAHDLGNILSPLSLQLELLRSELQADPELATVLERMSSVLSRGRQTLVQLRDFGRRSLAPPSAEPLEINEVAREALEATRMRVKRHPVPIDLHESLADGIPPVRVSAPELLSAIVNLLVNAIDALPEGGRITLRTGCREEQPWIEVEDDGTGMPPDVAQRAFEPFFTTKGRQGTGLGLASVSAFMTRHGGRVQLRTEPGSGTAISLRFAGAPRSALG